MNNLIQLPVSELKTALTGITKVTGKRSLLPVLQSIRVTRDRDGIVSLQGTDLDSFASYQTEQPQPGPSCEFLVPLDSLNRLVKKSSGKDTIGLLGEDGRRVTIRTFVGNNPVDQTVPSVEAKEWPPAPTVAQPPIALNQEFREAVAVAFECCSEDSSRMNLQGAWIDVSDPQAHYVVGTDGRHLVTTNSFCLDLRESVLIPHSKFLDWNGFMGDGEWKLAVKAPEKEEITWLKLQSDHWTFLTKQNQEKCPQWRNVIPREDSSKTTVQLSQAAVDFLLELLPKLPGYDGPYQAVGLDIENNSLTVKGRAKDATDWTSMVVPGVTTTGEPMSIRVDRQFLIKALKFGLTKLDLYDPLSPMLFHSGGRRLVVMPLRLEDPPPVKEPEATQPPQTSPATEAGDHTNPQPERNEAMAKTTETSVETTPANEAGIKTIVQHVEQIKDSLKGVIRDLNDLLDTVKKAEKEKRASEKDIEAVREKLREIQNVKI